VTDSAKVKVPKVPKPYPTRCPRAGEVVYVPGDEHPKRHIIGGRATVDVMGSDRRFTVVEVPDETFYWRDIAFRQVMLWREFGDSPARPPTDWERVALAAKRNADRAVAAAQRASLEQAERDRWLPRRFQVMNGGLLEVPIWGSHHRCKNWAAIVSLDPTKPGGIDRWWFNRGSGPVKLIVPNELEVHDPVEFGADYIRGSGYRDPERWYGVILEKELTHLLIEPCRDVLHALTLSVERQRVAGGEP
jgi:hypothetical protein